MRGTEMTWQMGVTTGREVLPKVHEVTPSGLGHQKSSLMIMTLDCFPYVQMNSVIGRLIR
jgi:hypothetical protein